MTLPVINNLYPVANGTASNNVSVPYFAARDPNANDLLDFPVGKRWINTTSNIEWTLKNFTSSAGVVTANWVNLSIAGDITNLTGDTGSAAPSGGAIKISGGGTGLVTNALGAEVDLNGVLNITHGGTNANAFANTDGVVYYDGTKLNSTTVGTSGQVLTSNGPGVAPTYQAVSAGGAVTSLAGDSGTATPNAGVITVSGGTTGLTTTGSSHTLSLGGTLGIANGGTNATSYTTDGVIYYDGSKLNSTAAGTSGFILTSNGPGVAPSYQALPFHSFYGFVYELNPSVTNATGDGTTYTIAFNTSIFDTTTGFNTSTGVWTPAVAGYYDVYVQVGIGNLSNTHTSASLVLTIGGSQNEVTEINPYAAASASGYCTLSTSAIFHPNGSSDTIYATITVTGGTKTVTVHGSSTLYTYIQAYKIG